MAHDDVEVADHAPSIGDDAAKVLKSKKETESSTLWVVLVPSENEAMDFYIVGSGDRRLKPQFLAFCRAILMARFDLRGEHSTHLFFGNEKVNGVSMLAPLSWLWVLLLLLVFSGPTTTIES